MHIDRTERTYMIIAGALIAVFFGLVVVSSLAYGIQVPAPEARVDPQTVATPGNSPWGDPIDERARISAGSV